MPEKAAALAATRIVDYVNGAHIGAAAMMNAQKLDDPRTILNPIMEGWN